MPRNYRVECFFELFVKYLGLLDKRTPIYVENTWKNPVWVLMNVIEAKDKNIKWGILIVGMPAMLFNGNVLTFYRLLNVQFEWLVGDQTTTWPILFYLGCG